MKTESQIIEEILRLNLLKSNMSIISKSRIYSAIKALEWVLDKGIRPSQDNYSLLRGIHT